MNNSIIENTPLLSIWKRRWIAQKQHDLFLVAILGICFATLTGISHILSPDNDSLLSFIFVTIVSVLAFMHELKILRIRKNAHVSVSNYGALTEKYAHSKYATTHNKVTRGYYATVRTPQGDMEVICDSHTYYVAKPGDLLLVLQVDNNYHHYGVSIEAN